MDVGVESLLSGLVMRKYEKKKCQICFKKYSLPGSVWDLDCYFNFATSHNVYGREALELFKKMNKKVNLIPIIKEPKDGK